MGEAYKALGAHVFPFVLIQNILSTQVSDTGPIVLWFIRPTGQIRVCKICQHW